MKLQNAEDYTVWDVSKAVSAVQQARDRLDAALKLVTLSRQVHEMQHQKFTLALATVEDVITAQRNLAAAQSHVVIARAIYARTLIQYEQAGDRNPSGSTQYCIVLGHRWGSSACPIFLAHMSPGISNGEVSKGHG